MHAVTVRVSIGDFEQSRQHLRERIVPAVSQAPGFVTGYWTRSEDGQNGLAMVVFQSEDAARSASEQIRSNIPDTVTLEGIEVREVVEHA